MTNFVPPGGKHDATCEFVCRNPQPSCTHSCKVCDAKRQRDLERRGAS